MQIEFCIAIGRAACCEVPLEPVSETLDANLGLRLALLGIGIYQFSLAK